MTSAPSGIIDNLPMDNYCAENAYSNNERVMQIGE